jgi:mannose-1-phosphate guanylyltransferase/phosphomannomutase
MPGLVLAHRKTPRLTHRASSTVQDATRVRGVLQAGGRGSRFGAATTEEPKPMQPVLGSPMIERLLRQFCDAGVRDVTVITGWRGHRIESHLNALSDLPADLVLRFQQEDHPLGNFGGMRHLPDAPGDLLFAFADLVTDMNLSTLLEVHRQGTSDITLASHEECYRVTLGELQTDGAQVLGYLEKPLKRYAICSGVAVLDQATLSCIPQHQPFGISDYITAAIRAGWTVTHWRHGAMMIDVNTPELQREAETALTRETP